MTADSLAVINAAMRVKAYNGYVSVPVRHLAAVVERLEQAEAALAFSDERFVRYKARLEQVEAAHRLCADKIARATLASIPKEET